MEKNKQEEYAESISQRVVNTPQSATVRIADLASELKRQGKNVLDFSAGRAAEHSPEYINRAACDAIMSGDTHQTMAQGKPEYREAIAGKLKRENNVTVDPAKEVIASLGCKQGLLLSLMALVNYGDEVIVEDPCFVSHHAEIRFSGGRSVPVPLREENGFRMSRDDLEAAITDRTKAILYCSPHNPTGTVHTEKDLDIIADVAKAHDLYVICDEVYESVTWGGRKHICMASRPGMKERAIGLMGLTKTFSMGGWRIGFVYAPEHVVKAMITLQQHLMTCAGSFTQAGAMKAFSEDPKPEVKDLWKDWEKRCEFCVDEINKIPGLSCGMPEGGFYAWINIKETGYTSVQLCEKLLQEQHIALVPGAAFGEFGEGYIRMTCVKSWEDLRAGLELLKGGIN